jgi:periplasmic protein TonB
LAPVIRYSYLSIAYPSAETSHRGENAMFDKLVESAKQKQGGRARRLFLATGAIYLAALTALGVATIVWISPALAEEYNILSELIPPPVPSGPSPKPVQIKPNLKPVLDHGFVVPKEPKELPDMDELNLELTYVNRVPGGPGNLTGIGNGVMPGAPSTGEAPPPPPPTPAPVVKPAATPAPDQVVRLTSKLTQGRVLRRVQPPYPAIAHKARIQGTVQVQIDISESGAVTNVTLLSGHPLLRDAAVQAAKQWLFIPTELNGRPVRAIGVLTFNFIFN